METKTVAEAFVEYLENEGVAVFNEDLFVGNVPDTAPDETYWLIVSGGSPILKLSTGEKVKQYFISVYFRSLKGKKIDQKLFDLEQKLNCASCVNLTDHVVYDVSAEQFPTDTDIDNIERRVGFLQTNIKLYKSC